MSKPQYQIVDLGVHHPDYFQGFGTSITPFDQSTYGIGHTAQEAYDDALESMAQSDCAALVLGDMPDDCPFDGTVPDGYEDSFYHVGIRWNNVKAEG